MKDILLKNVTSATLAIFLAVPVMATPESLWTSPTKIDNVSLGTSFQINREFPIPYGSNWAYGYDRVSTVKATATLIRDYYIYYNVYDDENGYCYWNYVDEDILTLPTGIQYTLVHEVRDGLGNLLSRDTAPVTIGEGDPLSPTWSSSYSLDSVNVARGQNIDIKTTDPISYSTKWAYNGSCFDKRIKIFVTSQGASTPSISSYSFMSVGNNIDIMTSSKNGEGTFQWNFESVSPATLPRGDTYTMTYSIYDDNNNNAVFQTENGVTTFTLAPEPSLALIALLAFGLSLRKFN